MEKDNFPKKGLICLIALSIGMSYVISAPIQAYAEMSDIKSETISFPMSNKINQSKTVKIPNLRHVKKITTDNGAVSFSQKGEDLTINVSGGTGSLVQTGGSLIPEDNKFVNGQTSPNYNIGGYSGLLTQYLYSGAYTPEQSKTTSITASTSVPTWNKQDSQATYPWEEDGYFGVLNKESISWTQIPQSVNLDITFTQYSSVSNEGKLINLDRTEILSEIKNQFGPNNTDGFNFLNPTIVSATWAGPVTGGSWNVDGVNYGYMRESDVVIRVDGFTLSAIYSGTIKKPASDTRVYRYEGTVFKPAVDTRTWETQYGYNINVEYTEKPNVPTINLTSSENAWVNKDVIFSIDDNELENLTDFRTEYRLPGSGNEEWKVYSNPVTISNEGIHLIEARVVDVNGDISDMQTKTVKIDKTPSVATHQLSSTNWSKNIVSIQLSATDDKSGVKRIRLPNGNWVNGDTVLYSAPENDNYIFIIEDYAGNQKTENIIVSKIDTTNPTINLLPDKTDWTKEDVLIFVSSNDSQSGVNRIQLPDGNWVSISETSYRITTNGQYVFTVEDNVGNKFSNTITISNIDKIAPSQPVFHTSNTGWAKDKSPFTLDGSIDSQSGIKKYQYKEKNGEWKDYSGEVIVSTEGIQLIKARAIDYAGNISNESSVSLYIDNSPPELTIKKETSNWTNKGVLLTATAKDDLSGVDKIQLPNGTWVNGITATQTVTESGTYTFKVRDKVGNERIESIFVENIDKTAPVLSLSPNNSALTNQDIIITASAYDNGSQIKRIQLPNGTWVNGGYALYTVTSNGNYIFVAEDFAGNQVTQSIQITTIDKIAPNIPTITNNQKWTKTTPLAVSVTPGTDSHSGVNRVEYKLEGATIQGWSKYISIFNISNEGETKVIARTVDNVGNISGESTSYVRIDKSVPYNKSITIKLKP